jgi:hypothetical protein
MSEVSVQLRFTALFKRRLKGLAKKYRQVNVSAEEIQAAIAQYQAELGE